MNQALYAHMNNKRKMKKKKEMQLSPLFRERPWVERSRCKASPGQKVKPFLKDNL
jgi:hypothetical protein